MTGKTTALPHLYSGKVRELYEVGHDRLLMVASDRVSVFDVVLPDLIPDKGRVLTGLSNFWFEQTADIVPNHVISCDPTDFPETAGDVAGRAMLVRAARPVPAGVRRARLPLRRRRGRSTRSRARSAASPCPPGCARPSRCPSRCSRRRRRPSGARPAAARRRGGRARRRGDATSSCGSSRCGSTSSGPSIARETRRDPRRHQVRVRRRSTARSS